MTIRSLPTLAGRSGSGCYLSIDLPADMVGVVYGSTTLHWLSCGARLRCISKGSMSRRSIRSVFRRTVGGKPITWRCTRWSNIWRSILGESVVGGACREGLSAGGPSVGRPSLEGPSRGGPSLGVPSLGGSLPGIPGSGSGATFWPSPSQYMRRPTVTTPKAVSKENCKIASASEYMLHPS